jgi:pyruvate kinase
MIRFQYPQLWITYGPKIQDDRMIEGLIGAGATGTRFTFSYGTPELQEERADQVRRLADRLQKDVFLVADLQGEKCRLAKIDGVDEISIERGEGVLLSASPVGTDIRGKVLGVQSPGFLNQVKVGDSIIEGDGGMVLEVISKNNDSVTCCPLWDGILHPGRGLVVRSSTFSPAPLTRKDREDLKEIARCGKFDAVAVSFVRDASDVHEVKDLLSSSKKDLLVIAKIETQAGLTQVDTIAKAADMIMAARGDLALFLPWVELYDAVQTISDAAKKEQCPWILATQLVEGLERFAFPTRAEICDLAHWITNGAFGAMLSFETAFGAHPIKAVECVSAVMGRYALEER